MPTEAPGYTMVVAVDGATLSADIASLLAGGYVDNSLNVPDMFVLHFSDENGTVIDKARLKIGSELKVSVQATGSEPPVVLLTGEITALEIDIDSSGKHLVVRGLDKSHKFLRGTHVQAYVNVKAGDVAQQIAGRAGVDVGNIESLGTVLQHIIQPGISDWEFLNQLASDVGAEVSVVDGKLNFCRPVDSATATSSTDSTRNPFVIQFGHNLISIRATITAADQVPQVNVRGWDPKTKQAVVATSKAATKSASLSKFAPASVAQSVHSGNLTETNTTIDTQARAQDRADAIADRLGGSFAELDGVATGNPGMKAGKAIMLSDVGASFDGKYTLTSTRHDFTPDGGYRTIFTVSNASDRSFYGVSTGVAGAAGHGPMSTGAMTAIVTDLNDSEAMGRVKVKIPALDDNLETWWARVVSPGAGATRGMVWLPEVGDEVLVVFGMGHVDEPYVLGGLFNGKDAPDKAWSDHINSGQVQRRALATRTGMVIELLEGTSEEKIVVSTKGGSQKVTIMQNGDKSIAIEASGPVTVKTSKDATVEASSGSISVKGMSVSVEATNALELKGATVKITAQGTAELSASGPTTIKGAMVQIN